MSDYIARGQDLERKADKKLNAWNLFGSKYDDAVELLHNSANSYKLAKSWDKAGSVFIKLSKCHLKLESKHEAAAAYVDAARCYKKTSAKGAISCLHQAISLYTEIGKYSMAARYCKELGDLYELDQDIENAALCFDRAAEFFDLADTTSSANQCKLKVAEFSALLQQYQKAIYIFEDIAQQSLNNNLLKYGVRGHLLNAGLCQICQGDIVAITKSLERYQDLDPTFSRVREYKLLAGLASAIDEEDVEKFTEEVKEFDSITPLDSWKTTLLLRAKQALKAKEMEEDDLT